MSLFRHYTLPYKLITNKTTLLDIPIDKIAPWSCREFKSEGALHIPPSSFPSCTILSSIPKLGRVVGDDVVLLKSDKPVVRLPTMLLDETQVLPWLFTIILYIVALFVFLFKKKILMILRNRTTRKEDNEKSF